MAILNHQRVYNIIVLFLDKVQYKPNSFFFFKIEVDSYL